MANGGYECCEVWAHEVDDLRKENVVLSKKVEHLDEKVEKMEKKLNMLEMMFTAMEVPDSRRSGYGQGKVVNPGCSWNEGVCGACGVGPYVKREWSSSGHGFCMNPECWRSWHAKEWKYNGRGAAAGHHRTAKHDRGGRVAGKTRRSCSEMWLDEATEM